MDERVRFRTIDGLRGLAALAVVFYHLNEALTKTYGPWIPASIGSLFEHGYLGVDVFFVISGFVIAYSVRNADLSLGFIGRFALRRSLRLDPPYWVTIALEIGLIWLGLHFALTTAPLPSVQQVLAHLVYLQNLLGYGDIVDIFWTLCFEIQFYLGLIILLVIHRKVEAVVGRPTARKAAFLTLAALFIYSVLVRYHGFGLSVHPGFAMLRWFQFFMGVCVWWVVSGRGPWQALVGTWLVTAGIVVWLGEPFYQLLAIGVTALLWWSYRRDQMTSLFSSRPLQFLGAISYSLYLFHASIGWRLVRLTGRWIDQEVTRPVVWLLFGLAVGVCIVVSWIAWRLLEKPALKLSRRVALSSHEKGRPASTALAD